MIEIRFAGTKDLDELTNLFDRYRLFYKQSSDLNTARSFLQERLERGDSTIMVADRGNRLAGFTQLYPSFSSVSMGKIWILNDLFVADPDRQQGIGSLLMNAAEEFARSTGAIRISLATQVTNHIAQSLYRSRGYIKNEDFYNYGLSFN